MHVILSVSMPKSERSAPTTNTFTKGTDQVIRFSGEELHINET